MNQSCEYSRTMRSPYDDFSIVSDSGEEGRGNSYSYGNKNYSCTIPYHARENSLPFSYGQINKTPTSLRSVGPANGIGGLHRPQHGADAVSSDVIDFGFGSSLTPSKADENYNMDADLYCGANYNNGLTATLRSTTTPTAKKSAQGSSTDAISTIKAQPRLTSPILVRKTLNSRSPTRNGATNTNTIANTYHYKYGNDDDNIFGAPVGISSRSHNNTLKGKFNSDNNDYSNDFKHNNDNSSKTHIFSNNKNKSNKFGIDDTVDGSMNVRKIHPRDDFEELLRERREKVFREHYRSVGSTQAIDGINGSRFETSPNAQKFNYDFEFHLNVDDAPPPPRRAHTMDRSSLQQLQQYRTRDIPVAREVVTPTVNSSIVERNYHTIGSSIANRKASETCAPTQQNSLVRQQIQPQQPQHQQRREIETLYSTVEKRTSKPSQKQQSLSPSPIQTQQPLRPTEYSPYGNGNASTASYGFDNHNEYATNNRSSLGAAVVARSRNDVSPPIYATTTKHITTAKKTYHNHIVSEPELSLKDHTLGTSLSLPIDSASAGAVNEFELGKISPSLVTRPETPAFPVTPRTPHGAYNGQNSPTGYSPSSMLQHTDLTKGKSMLDLHNYSSETIYRTSCRPRLDSNMSMVNSEPQEVAAHLVKFAKDSSKYWYKPNLSREEVVQLLLHAEPGTFIVRNSTTYKDNYGLVVRVYQPPPNSELTGQPDDLVRHFLIEPTKHGVRLKSCANEPVFTSLSALIYEHSINKLALPCLLRIPEHDLVPSLIEPTSAQKQLLTQGAACNVLWLYSCDTESLTGEEAIRKAIRQLYSQDRLHMPTEVHFKVTQQGITLTDNTRKKFFRKHYPGDSISFCAIDPDHRLWEIRLTEEEGSDKNSTPVGALKKTIFAFVARSTPKSKDNQCHVFCDLDIHQPASAIVSFVNKTLPTEKERNFVL
ncbi:tensin-1 [Bactrocera neohumeralis]|uniref:tensin-1 n=1 Tax=Bactrocera neohumeralis TaxID=98809 RepID=UPI0021653940|nr:tensin-1 [Bactrocera neohumeralis]